VDRKEVNAAKTEDRRQKTEDRKSRPVREPLRMKALTGRA
jgi:hypothetical protein